ncbi:MAG: Wzz/FepE/Etk N-terminal domain-containing protein [Pseudomonadota bacterium]
MNEEFSLEDALIILRRRIWYFIAPILIIAPIGFVIVMTLPKKYEARGTILVESQQIPENLIRSTINAYAQERIQTIRQRVMTLNRVNEVATKYNVFVDQPRLSDSERAQRMRQRVNVSLITVERGVRSGDGTIAFTVSYQDTDPQRAYLVANEFMTLFLAEDLRTRTAGASNTTEFFQREADKLQNEVARTEQRISKFKSDNADSLPEHLDMHLNMLERANQELASIQRMNDQLEEEKQFLASQIAAGGQAGGLPARLASLETELARLRSLYTDDYPEIRATRSEIAEVKRQMAPSPALQRLRDELADAEDAIDALERASADMQAISEAEVKVEFARQALSDEITAQSRNGADASNFQTEGRIAIIDNRIRMNSRRENTLRARIGDLQARIEATPAIERQLAALTRDYDSMDAQYQELRNKQQSAALAESLEVNQQAEKFSILEPATRPHSPSSPDRPKLIVLALFAACAAGGACAVLAELFFAALRGRSHITSIMGDHPMAVVPYIQSDDEVSLPARLFRRLRRAGRGRKALAPAE